MTLEANTKCFIECQRNILLSDVVEIQLLIHKVS